MGFLSDVVGSFTGKFEKKAAGAMEDSAYAQQEAIRKAKSQVRKGYKPYEEAGRQGIADWQSTAKGLRDLQYDIPEWQGFSMEDYKDPGYDFRMGEGMRAIERRASAQGHRMGGKSLIDLMRYGQGMGAQEYGAARQRALGDYRLSREYEGEDWRRRYGQGQDYQRSSMGLSELGMGAMGQRFGHDFNYDQLNLGAMDAAAQAKASGYLARGSSLRNLVGMGAQAFGAGGFGMAGMGGQSLSSLAGNTMGGGLYSIGSGTNLRNAGGSRYYDPGNDFYAW